MDSRITPISLEFLFGEKEVPEVFWVGIAFFFSFWSSSETGISGLNLVSVDNTHRFLRPVVCFSGIFFFFLRQNRVFIGDSASGALGLRSRRFLLGVRGQKYLGFGTFNKKKINQKNREAFSYHLFWTA